MVHVPIGGILKCIRIVPSTGEGIVLTSDWAVTGGGDWPFEHVEERRRRAIARWRTLEYRCHGHWANQSHSLTKCAYISPLVLSARYMDLSQVGGRQISPVFSSSGKAGEGEQAHHSHAEQKCSQSKYKLCKRSVK